MNLHPSNLQSMRESRLTLSAAVLLLSCSVTACGGGATPAPETPPSAIAPGTSIKPEMRCAP